MVVFKFVGGIGGFINEESINVVPIAILLNIVVDGVHISSTVKGVGVSNNIDFNFCELTIFEFLKRETTFANDFGIVEERWNFLFVLHHTIKHARDFFADFGLSRANCLENIDIRRFDACTRTGIRIHDDDATSKEGGR